MIINYSNQPYEPVIDMQERINSDFIMYEEIETIRLVGSGSNCKMVSMHYGMLKASSDNTKSLNTLANRLNSEYQSKATLKVFGERDIVHKKYLPIRKKDSIQIQRICMPIRRYDVELLTPHDYPDFKELSLKLQHGLYLCIYQDYPIVKIRPLAKSDIGLSLIHFGYSLKYDAFWKTAIIDSRLEREWYVSDSINKAITFRPNENMSQDEIDRRIAEILAEK